MVVISCLFYQFYLKGFALVHKHLSENVGIVLCSKGLCLGLNIFQTALLLSDYTFMQFILRLSKEVGHSSSL